MTTEEDPRIHLHRHLKDVVATNGPQTDHYVGIEKDNWVLTRNTYGVLHLLYRLDEGVTVSVYVDPHDPLNTEAHLITGTAQAADFNDIRRENLPDMAKFVLEGMLSPLA